MKTVRFAELVARAGKPEPHQLWSDPGRDRTFQRARKEHRVLTIHQENVGTKKDFGVVGFHEEPRAQFVIFPKSIREFEGRRVIGINYDLLEQPAMTFAAAAPVERVKPPSKSKPPARPAKKTAAPKSERPAGRNRPRRTESESTTEPKPESPPEKTPMSAKPARPEPALDPSIAREITRAMKELKAGKAVAAYERLQRVVGAEL